ncbi:MAG TPA: DNA cytosine methyltransferase, partial [Candidatus Binatia bacterium]|nr:DNA cytosine methyltransferase [Candidatus Binatia bacterium]
MHEHDAPVRSDADERCEGSFAGTTPVRVDHGGGVVIVTRPSVLSLFTGAGGMDLGLEAAGFQPVLCVEMDEDSRATLKKNRPGWRLAKPGDIHA